MIRTALVGALLRCVLEVARSHTILYAPSRFCGTPCTTVLEACRRIAVLCPRSRSVTYYFVCSLTILWDALHCIQQSLPSVLEACRRIAELSSSTSSERIQKIKDFPKFDIVSP